MYNFIKILCAIYCLCNGDRYFGIQLGQSTVNTIHSTICRVQSSLPGRWLADIALNAVDVNTRARVLMCVCMCGVTLYEFECVC